MNPSRIDDHNVLVPNIGVYDHVSPRGVAMAECIYKNTFHYLGAGCLKNSIFTFEHMTRYKSRDIT